VWGQDFASALLGNAVLRGMETINWVYRLPGCAIIAKNSVTRGKVVFADWTTRLKWERKEIFKKKEKNAENRKCRKSFAGNKLQHFFHFRCFNVLKKSAPVNQIANAFECNAYYSSSHPIPFVGRGHQKSRRVPCHEKKP